MTVCLASNVLAGRVFSVTDFFNHTSGGVWVFCVGGGDAIGAVIEKRNVGVDPGTKVVLRGATLGMSKKDVKSVFHFQHTQSISPTASDWM